MPAHLSFENLLEYVSQTLPPTDQALAEAHLAGPCAECRIDLQRARQILHVLAQPDRTVAPPPEVARRASALFEPRSTWTAIPQIVAKLLFDSYQQAPAAALRGASHTRQLLFSTEDLDIDMQITPERNSATLIGQVLRRSAVEQPAMHAVRLYQAGEVMDTSFSDTLGQFTFRAVPPGRYDVGVGVDPQMVIIQGVEFQHD